VRVVEIGQYTTAPLCARHLAHLGAEVIKVEQPGGDHSRTWVPHVGARSVSFRLNNADKRSLVLDLRSASGDILVENTKPGTLAKFGLSPSEIQALNPRLVYCAISGFGAQSLYAARPAFDMVIQAMSGFMTALSPDGVPLKSGISTADTMGAEMAMVAVLGALEYRDRTGRGQYIDLSMQDITCWLTQTVWNREPVTRPIVIECSDGYVMVEASEAELRRVLTTSGGVAPEQLEQQSRTEVVGLIVRLGLAAAPVNGIRESSELPQTHERRLWYTMSEDALDWPMLASPLRLYLTPPRVSHLAPDVNQDGEAILGELGVTVEEPTRRA
jgi:crotonobetainyl-CoA:carnitine CoA-transferase CaiB-like acyl-CoA transferase